MTKNEAQHLGFRKAYCAEILKAALMSGAITKKSHDRAVYRMDPNHKMPATLQQVERGIMLIKTRISNYHNAQNQNRKNAA